MNWFKFTSSRLLSWFVITLVIFIARFWLTDCGIWSVFILIPIFRSQLSVITDPISAFCFILLKRWECCDLSVQSKLDLVFECICLSPVQNYTLSYHGCLHWLFSFSLLALFSDHNYVLNLDLKFLVTNYLRLNF